MPTAPLVFVGPVVVAAVLAGLNPLGLRRAAGVAAVMTAAATAVFTGFVLARVGGRVVVEWMGNWAPERGRAVGVAIVPDPFGTALALLACALTVAATLAATRLIRAADQLFLAIVLVFLGAACGFCVAGDLFTLFVFLELMSVSAYVLVGYEVRRRSAVEGALTFAVTTSLGTILLVVGIALVYGRTGALNLAAVGEALGARRPDAVVAVAWALIAGGLLVKAAAVPFHFWIADAYAVAPTPVALLLSGVFAELGLFGLARVHWTAFHPALAGEEDVLRALLVGLGIATALTGAVLAAAQHHLKRLLAFATVAQVGLLLCGVGLLGPEALAGVGVWVVGDGLVKATLFGTAGIVQHHCGTVDERALHGRGCALGATGALFLVAALAVTTLPPFGPFLGKALVEGAAEHEHGYGWLPAAMVVISALIGGTLLRVWARVFLGRGAVAPEDPNAGAESGDTPDERDDGRGRPSPLVWGPAAVLLLGALAWGLLPGLPDAAARAAARFTDSPGYARAVLQGIPMPASRATASVTATAYLYGAASVAGALLVAALALQGRAARTPGAARRALRAVRALHSGRIGDYAAWLAAGFGALTVALLLAVG